MTYQKSIIMKTKKLIAASHFAAAVFFSAMHANAQSWNINGNANIAAGSNYLGTTDPNDLVFRTNAVERGRLFGVGGAWRFGSSTNNAQFDSLGILTFKGTGVYQVAGNKYAFQYKNDPDFGLFFNSADVRYEFRNGTAIPVFYINANTGAPSIGNNTINQNYVLPSARGANNQILRTDANGNVSWSAETAYTAGTGLSLVGTTFSNTAPDRIVTLAGTNGITTSGTYPNFTINGNGLWKTTGNSGTTTVNNFIGTTDAQGLAFRTNNVERMRLASGGNVGIGTVNPDAKLHIEGGVDVALGSGGTIVMGPTSAANLAMDNNEIQARNNGAAAALLLNNGGGNINMDAGTLFVDGTDNNVGINTSNPQARLHVTGGTDVTLTSGGTIIMGLTNDFNLAMDNTELQARNNGAAATLNLNQDGGNVSINGGNVIIDPTALEMRVHGDVVPDQDGFHQLGTSANTWAEVWATDVTINSSDARLKKDVADLNYGLDAVMKLHPVSYHWIKNPDGQDGKKRLGLIAQEVQNIIPEIVRDWQYKGDEKTGKIMKVPVSKLGIQYDAIIPVLIKAIQEQQQEIEALKKATVKETKVNDATSSTTEVSAANIKLGTANLEQNIPNPLRNNTSIRYSIPADTKSAFLLITDMNGKTVKQLPIKSGSGVINIDASLLNTGTYSYTLVVNGKTIETKKMVVAR